MVTLASNLELCEVGNFIDNQIAPAQSGEYFDKLSPHDGKLLWRVASSDIRDVLSAVSHARRMQTQWSLMPPVQRGLFLFRACNLMELERSRIAEIVAAETGKSLKDALGETDAAIALGRFYAGEGQRLYSRTTTSGVENRYNMIVRQPCGVAALIVAANTPIANVAWKTFPALICGNTVVLKAAEDTPKTALIFADILRQAGLPAGVVNVLQGFGQVVGASLVSEAQVDVISFTGSTEVGRWIGKIAGERLLKCSLELGGKNPFVVCDDADLDQAVHWAILSAFSNAGQRCAAGSRIIIFDAIYKEFVTKLIAATEQLRIGNSDQDNLGPVINVRSLERMLNAVNKAKNEGATILCGGSRLKNSEHANGFYVAPTLLENVNVDSEISNCELFGPIAVLYRVKNFEEALNLANASSYGLTAAIHTQNYHRALQFVQAVQSGVATVNGGTFGSEPHMPFGGLKQSGNGTREPGTEALDIYTELKNIYFNVLPNHV